MKIKGGREGGTEGGRGLPEEEVESAEHQAPRNGHEQGAPCIEDHALRTREGGGEGGRQGGREGCENMRLQATGMSKALLASSTTL